MAVIEEECKGESDSRSRLGLVVAEPSGYCFDGCETSKDTELNDSISNNDNGLGNRNDARSGRNDGDEVSREDNERVRQEKVEIIEAEANEKILAKARDAKLEGNSYFNAGEYEEPLAKYEVAIQVSLDCPSSDEIWSICHANRAACFSKLEKYEDTVKECSKELDLNPTYTKALIRRGETREKLEQYEESIADVTKILKLDPTNDQARRSIIHLKAIS